MTVKMFDEVTKNFICEQFVSSTLKDPSSKITLLTALMDCSRRTIIRVLQERDIDPGLPTRTRKTITKNDLLVAQAVQAGIPLMTFELLPAPSVEDMSGFPIMKVEMIEPQPWWKRLGQAVSRAFT